MKEAHFSQAVRATELQCFGFVYSQLKRHCGIYRTAVPEMFSLTSGLFQEADNSNMQLESNTPCTHTNSESYGCVFLPLNRRLILATGYQFHLQVAISHVLSSRVEFSSVILKSLFL